MTRIVGSKRPQAVITTTSWKDGRENVNKILKSRKIKSTMQATEKTKKTKLDKFDDKGKTTANTCKFTITTFFNLPKFSYSFQ